MIDLKHNLTIDSTIIIDPNLTIGDNISIVGRPNSLAISGDFLIGEEGFLLATENIASLEYIAWA